MKQNLIYDIGLHTGEDTAYYLEKGFKVIAFEANPELVAGANTRFAEAIQHGKLKIISGAICDAPESHINFYVKAGQPELGTVISDWAKRNEIYAGKITKIQVPVVRLEEILLKHGVPYYMKIDIEGVDRHCLNVLRKSPTKPTYLSLELERENLVEAETDLNLLRELGYSCFNIINQQSIPGTWTADRQKEGNSIRWKFPTSCSGEFGRDLRTPWHPPHIISRKIKRLHWNYKIFGNSSFLRRFKIGRYNLGPEFIHILEALFKKPIPGWHDLHAQHSQD